MMFFIFFENGNVCRHCVEWERRTNDCDGCDIGLCKKFNRMSLEGHDCRKLYEFLREIGFEHTTKCGECQFNINDESCLAKIKLKQCGDRVLDEESCPIKMIYKNIKQEELI